MSAAHTCTILTQIKSQSYTQVMLCSSYYYINSHDLRGSLDLAFLYKSDTDNEKMVGKATGS